MTPMPIVIPVSRGDEANNITYPVWATGTAKVGLLITLIGVTALLVCLTLWMITDDDRFDLMDKPAVYTFAVATSGVVVMLIGAVLMIITGVPATE